MNALDMTAEDWRAAMKREPGATGRELIAWLDRAYAEHEERIRRRQMARRGK